MGYSLGDDERVAEHYVETKLLRQMEVTPVMWPTDLVSNFDDT